MLLNTWYFHTFSNLNDSIWIKKKRYIFQKCRNFHKNSKSQVGWPHNGLKKNYRFFGIRISQFVKKLKKNWKIENFQKNSKSWVRVTSKAKNRVKFFLLHFWSQNDSIRKKKQKKIVFFTQGMEWNVWNVWNLPHRGSRTIFQ